MAIRNLMEDIITFVVKEVIQNEMGAAPSGIYEQDIIAYVLNRVPPRYITSERGIIHGKLDSKFKMQQRTDILFLIHEAIRNIKTRRTPTTHGEYVEKTSKEPFLPHIMGEVVEETTFSIVNDIEVTLLFKGKPAAMIDSTWKNPFLVKKATKGFYHFWPAYVAGKMDERKPISFSLRFAHPKFATKEIVCELALKDNLNLYESIIVPISLVQIKEGVDQSFLDE
jgi:competence protein ComFB